MPMDAAARRLNPETKLMSYGLGWRISKEGFLENNKILTDAMLISSGITVSLRKRVGWRAKISASR